MVVLFILSAVCFVVYFVARAQYDACLERMYRRDNSKFGRLFSAVTNQSLNDLNGESEELDMWGGVKIGSFLLGIVLLIIAIIVACV